MHLDDSETDQLKTWIVKRLEDISDADSDVLADYVLALVKSDETDDQVRQNCQENLDDFLKEHTVSFVNDVFGAIATKSFDPSRPQQAPVAPAAAAFNPPTGPTAKWPTTNNNGNLQSRKRTFNDWEGAEGENGHLQNGRDRPMKQMRRGGRGGFEQRGGGFDQRGQRPGMGMNNNMGMNMGMGMSGQHGQMPQLPTPPPGMPPFDPNNPLATLMAMQAMGMPSLPGMPALPAMPFSPSATGFPQQPALPPKRPGERCKDYDTKGFCALGASCPYEHGNDHFVVPSKQDEYDPTNSSLSHPSGQESRGYNERGRGRGRGRGDRGAHRGGRGGRAEFSMAGPNHDQSIASIVVEQIPEDKMDEQTVREFFAEFGNVEEVTLQPYKRLAIVKYDEYSSAKAAKESRKAIFDDRFVKVFWYNPNQQSRHHEGHRNNRGRQPEEDVEMAEEEEKIDPVELAKRQEEAQRAHEEKTKKVKEAEAAREELEKKLKAQAEERNQLLAKLAAKERAKSGTPDQSAQATNGSSEPSQTDALKAKLAELQREAESMGINPNEEAQPWQGFPPRGRGGYRGRGTFAPRGAWRGRGGFAPRGGAVMRLDNRPRNIAVVFPDNQEMGPEKDEALRQYLLFNDMMESADVLEHPDRKDAALLSFKERYLAEKFIGQAKEIPHIGNVELSWVANNVVPATSTPSTFTPTTGAAGSVTGNGSNGAQQDVKMEDSHDTGRAEIDYDVADDDDRWLIE